MTTPSMGAIRPKSPDLPRSLRTVQCCALLLREAVKRPSATTAGSVRLATIAAQLRRVAEAIAPDLSTAARVAEAEEDLYRDALADVRTEAIEEAIRDSLDTWYGRRHPDPDWRETISAGSLEHLLRRVARAAGGAR